MRILITGKTGQLGKSFQHFISNNKELSEKHSYIFSGRDDIDFSSNASISEYFQHNHFDVIINCVAYTQVEQAEREPEVADQINHLAVRQLAYAASQSGAKLIHISTDYVFDGNATKPYTELDTPNPSIMYAKTKFLGELALQDVMSNNAMIIRSGWIYSQHGTNFVDSMLKRAKNGEHLRVVADQIGTPVYVNDLMLFIFHIIDSKKFNQGTFPTSVYHFSNLGQCSWYEFAKEALLISGLEPNITPITTSESGASIKRPAYTVLDKKKVSEELGLQIPTWQSSLRVYLTT